jgi:tetratricopeptide (TPR) repeat protein
MSLADNVQKNSQDDSSYQWTIIKTDNELIDKAQDCFNKGLYSETITYLEQFLDTEHLSSKESRALVYAGLGSSYIEKGIGSGENGDIEKEKYYKQSVPCFENALKLIKNTDSLNISIYSGLGFAYFQLRDYSTASAYLKKGLTYPVPKFKRERIDIYTNLGYINIELKKYRKAVRYFKRASNLSLLRPQILPVFFGLSISYRELHDCARAADYLNKGLNSFLDGFKKEDVINYKTNLEQLPLILNQYQEMSDYCNQTAGFSTEDYRKFSVYSGMVTLYSELKDYIRSGDFAKFFITHQNKLNEKRIDMYIRLGYLAFSLKRYQDAIGYFNQGLEFGPGDYQIFPLYLGLVTCYRELSDYDKAVSCLKNGMRYFIDKAGLKYVFLTLKQYEETNKYFNQILKLPAEDPLLLELTSFFKEYLQNKGLKELLASPVGKFKNETYDIAIVLGNIAIDLKLYPAAIGYLNLALKFSSNDSKTPLIYLALGTCYRELKDYDQAISYLNKGLNCPLVH